MGRARYVFVDVRPSLLMPINLFRPVMQIGMEKPTTRSPNEGIGGENSTALTDPLAPARTARSIHRPSFPGAAEEVDGSSHIRTVRSWEHEARRDP